MILLSFTAMREMKSIRRCVPPRLWRTLSKNPLCEVLGWWCAEHFPH
jgi:hypothetical protein